ncbi:hypothetical protein LWI29_015948 [Acer saccharum]|uniref:Uncharacterized protein n=1 Tax=Acer saccharum TaxID=4024 RepID=A0AA39VT34_ACESA|nr:hypothetical protein LWI29_015948 [Acer saccharum]
MLVLVLSLDFESRVWKSDTKKSWWSGSLKFSIASIFRSFGSRRNSSLPQEFAGKEKNQFVKSICTHLNMVHCICHLQAKKDQLRCSIRNAVCPLYFQLCKKCLIAKQCD